MPWTTGPFAEPVRALLAARAEKVQRSLKAHDERAARLRRRSDEWVVTHGEPHRANLIVDTAGAPYLVDWDTTLMAPRRRDLWHVLDEERTGWEEYAAIVGAVALDTEALEYYRQGWDLADIAAFVAEFRRPRGGREHRRIVRVPVCVAFSARVWLNRRNVRRNRVIDPISLTAAQRPRRQPTRANRGVRHG